MAEKGIDLRTIFTKTKLKNTNINGINNDTLDTTDIAFLPSAIDFENISHEQRMKSLSDFTISNADGQSVDCKAANGKYSGFYWTRSTITKDNPPIKGCLKIIQADGGFGWTDSNSEWPLPVALNMNAEALVNALNNSQNVKITTKKVGASEKHFVELGEYPNKAVSQDMQKTLEKAFNGGNLKKGLTCTGRLYTTNGQDGYIAPFLSKQNPEFEYNGEKYVRVITRGDVWSDDYKKYESGVEVPRIGEAVWHKVEPIKLEILNWNDLPRSINPNGTGKSDTVKTETEECVLTLPFYPGYNRYDNKSAYWQNSLIRAFLNSAKSSELDGNSKFKIESEWDFTNSGFLYQAFDMSREPTRVYTIPKAEDSIAAYAFVGCVGIEKIIIPSQVKQIDYMAFAGCKNTKLVFENPNRNLLFASGALSGTDLKFVYLSKDGKNVIFSPNDDEELNQSCFKVNVAADDESIAFNSNFRENYIKLMHWKESGKIKFIPPEYTIQTFPTTELSNYFVNNNNQRWAKLVKTLGFDTLQNEEKANSLTDLMKIYYAIGGFSENQGESEKAYDYIVKYVARVPSSTLLKARITEYLENPTPNQIGAYIHRRFSKLQLNGPYNPEFAKFFMKYYKDNPNFMVFDLYDDYYEEDYLCSAHNFFADIQKAYPNRVVNGNEERALLTPHFVAEHCSITKYDFVDIGNEALANLVGRYGYTQDQFEHIQDLYNRAKTLKDKYIISADKADEEYGISFRVLDKDDPLGFVLGDITNCCQHIGGVGEDCVDDGYLNPEAGFLVFEETILDANGTTTDKRILGQAYVWYDPKTKTVCYDNIEIPTKILNELQKGDKHNARLSSAHLLDAVVKSAEMIMLSMNKKGFKVERVTTGKGFNDLAVELQKRFGAPEYNPKAKHRNYYGYSDAEEAQYIIKDIRKKHRLGFTKRKIKSVNSENVNDADHEFN